MSDAEDRLSPGGENIRSYAAITDTPEHVSVIAGPTLTHKVASPQTEAMDLSHHKSPTENPNPSRPPSATISDNEIPMDLSSNDKPTSHTPPTPLTPPTSVPERKDHIPPQDVQCDKDPVLETPSQNPTHDPGRSP